ncbi:hypothetical protein [Halarchaeum salinum]|uniref:Signal transduction histidine kinase dimerisation/phosphoacceptor domain-containing protein n=1 Tax=Halarchaeum salinum TaxID=489912 RepID=A0AAV3SAB5_9EURY
MTDHLDVRYGFYGLGLCCFGLGLLHLLGEGEGIGTLLEAILISSLSLIVFYTGYQLPTRSLSAHGQRRALGLSLAMTVSFALLALAVWLVWLLEGKQIELTFLLSFAASLGAAVGTRGSLSKVESQEQLEQAEELSTLLEINQRVLRHNLRNDLSVAFGYLDKIESTTDRDDIQDDCHIIRTRLNALDQTSERARQIVSIWERETTRTFDLVSLLKEQIAAFRETHPDTDVTLSVLPNRREHRS